MIFREVGQDALVYLILAECRLIFPEAQASQPDHNVHRGAPTFSGEADHPPGVGSSPGQFGVGLSEDRKTAEVKQAKVRAREHWKAEGATKKALRVGALAIGNERLAGTGISLPHESERVTL
jgi:hypothetical protein